jgi:hypothetical protein
MFQESQIVDGCHVSYVPEKGRKQFLRAFKEDGKTKYKPIIGKAVDLV